MSNSVKPSKLNLENEVTPELVFLNRRRLLKGIGFMTPTFLGLNPIFANEVDAKKVKYKDKELKPTKEDLITNYNNYYEFSFEKTDVKKKSENWKKPKPWTVEVGGLIENPKTWNLEDLIKLAGPIEQRIYRFRCVEAWSMVIPWGGFSLKKLIEKLKPKNSAKYVKFTTHLDSKQMPEINRSAHYPWPYTEGLRMDEALHDLTLMATQIYGKDIQNQNGAPLRLVVPWKYGFKSIKSIAKIEFVEQEPQTLWKSSAPNEYGFFANVNPNVDHPRWSQANERVIDGSFLPKRIKTLMFNGYEEEVASLYKGMNLKTHF